MENQHWIDSYYNKLPAPAQNHQQRQENHQRQTIAQICCDELSKVNNPSPSGYPNPVKLASNLFQILSYTARILSGSV